ncbi:MAG TPA: hypothetical protein VF828_02605, partial [Patescibacteria group bacterium]
MKDKWQNILKAIADWAKMAAGTIKNKMPKIEINIRSRRFWYSLFLSILILMVIGSVGVMVLFAYFSKDLPTPNKVVRHDGYTT